MTLIALGSVGMVREWASRSVLAFLMLFGPVLWPLLVWGVSVWFRRRGKLTREVRVRRFERAWQKATRGITSGQLSEDSFVIRSDGLEVRVEPFRKSALGNERTRLRVTVRGDPPIPDAVTIRTRRHPGPGARAVPEGGVETGDPAFDERIELKGPAAPLLALLDESLRDSLCHYAGQDHFRVEGGEIAWESGSSVQSAEGIRRRVDRARDLAHLLQEPSEGIPRRLAHNALRDSLQEVRLANLQALQRFDPEPREAREVSRTALRDDAATVRLAAATFLGPEARDTLVGIAGGSGIPAATRAQALLELARSAPREMVLPLLDVALAGKSGPLLTQALALAGRLRHVTAISRMIAWIDADDPETTAAVARSLGEIADPSTEATLLGLLRYENVEVAAAAAQALGQAGSVDAVGALRERSETRSRDASLEDALRQAIAAIQHRLGGAEPGQLALAEDGLAQGRLSIQSPSAAGTVSFPADPPRREAEKEP